jgi:hypothetical protein
VAVYDGNRDGNVGNQRRPEAATDSQILQRGRPELAIRYTCRLILLMQTRRVLRMTIFLDR